MYLYPVIEIPKIASINNGNKSLFHQPQGCHLNKKE